MSTPTKLETIQQYMAQTYFGLRIVMAALAFSFPLLLIIGGALHHQPLGSSLSAYYELDDGRMRDVFVGGLWAVGMMLLAYRGLHWSESLALAVAGICGVGIASIECHCAGQDTHSGAHNAFAIAFFLCVGFVCAFRALDTLPLLPKNSKPSARAFTITYRVVASLMAGLPLLAHLLIPPSISLLVAEALGIYAFGAFWLVKSHELKISDAERDIARGRVVRIEGAGLARVAPTAPPVSRGRLYPVEMHPDAFAQMNNAAGGER